jgi:O-antigen ligase
VFLVLAFAGGNVGGQFYGTFARNTGGLAYLSLALLLLSSALVADMDFIKRFMSVVFFVGLLLIIYGNIQYLGLEPFPFVNAYTINAPIGTFGNPDFQSAFMGMIAVVAFTMALNAGYKVALRFSLVLMGLASMVVVFETLAKQGYLNFLAGAGAVAILWLFMNNRRSIGIAVSSMGIVAGVFLGLVNAGPLASLLYKGSLAARGFYWRAAIRMLIDHPFFGVGMDGFIDWYRRARPSNFVEAGFFTYSNTAHNVYLDIASSGGIPLLAIYLAMLSLVILSVVRVVKRNNGFDVYFVAVVGAWVAYQTQAFVSINQLGLAIWGWVLSGLIIGYEINTRSKETEKVSPINNRQVRKTTKVSAQPLSSATVIRVFAGVVIGALVAIPPYYANASFFSSLKSNDIKAIQAAAYLKPIDERRLLHIATILRDNKMDSAAISVIRDATKGYPDSFDFWQLWSTIPTATPSDLANAKTQMKRLDPLNPELK